jgi:hypothetical protein
VVLKLADAARTAATGFGSGFFAHLNTSTASTLSAIAYKIFTIG